MAVAAVWFGALSPPALAADGATGAIAAAESGYIVGPGGAGEVLTTRSTVIGTMDGEDVVASLTVTGAANAIGEARAATADSCPFGASPAGSAGCDPPYRCRTVYSEYRIYFPFGPTLLRWKFEHRWCFQFGLVDTLEVSNDRVFISGTIRLSGAWSHRQQGRLGQLSVQSFYDGMQFEYCTLAGVCIKSFNPKIHYYLGGSGLFHDFSVL